jgi:elongation factor P
MRGVENGIKVGTRFRTTEQVELCYIEDAEYQYLYKDSEAFVFMNQVTFDQVTVPNTVVGEQEIYLQDSMVVTVKLYEGKVIAVILPANLYAIFHPTHLDTCDRHTFSRLIVLGDKYDIKL